MMRRLLLLALVATPAQAMTVAEFMARAEALKAKGMMAMFSADLKPVMAEMKAVGPAWRAQLPTAQPPVCPPKGVRMDEAEMRRVLEAVPPAERPRLQVKDAFIRELNARYRCR